MERRVALKSQYHLRERVDQILNAPDDLAIHLLTQAVLTSWRKMRVLHTYAIVTIA